MLVGVVADRVALERIGLERRDVAVDLVHPARRARHEDRVREHALRTGELVHLGARVHLHLVRQEPVARLFRARARDECDLGVAVEIDFLEVVRELQILDRLRLARERGVPAGLADRFARAHEAFQPRVVAQEVGVHVHDELVGEGARAFVRHVRRRRFRAAHAEERSVDVVHRDERRGHAGRALEELAAREALVLRELATQLFHARFDPLLVLRLRARQEFVARDELRRDRRRKRRRFSREQCCQLVRVEL
jgi:hypothetical protein